MDLGKLIQPVEKRLLARKLVQGVCRVQMRGVEMTLKTDKVLMLCIAKRFIDFSKAI